MLRSTGMVIKTGLPILLGTIRMIGSCRQGWGVGVESRESGSRRFLAGVGVGSNFCWSRESESEFSVVGSRNSKWSELESCVVGVRSRSWNS